MDLVTSQYQKYASLIVCDSAVTAESTSLSDYLKRKHAKLSKTILKKRTARPHDQGILTSEATMFMIFVKSPWAKGL